VFVPCKLFYPSLTNTTKIRKLRTKKSFITLAPDRDCRLRNWAQKKGARLQGSEAGRGRKVSPRENRRGWEETGRHGSGGRSGGYSTQRFVLVSFVTWATFKILFVTAIWPSYNIFWHHWLETKVCLRHGVGKQYKVAANVCRGIG